MAKVTKNLLSVFQSKGIEDEELPDFLNSHFGSSAHRSETNEVFYPNDSAPALVLVYKKGRLVEVHAEPSVSDGEIDELCDLIFRKHIGTSETGFRQEVLLSHARVSGAWRYRDMFQLLPIPANAPQAPFPYIGAEYPLLIEHSYIKRPAMALRVPPVASARCIALNFF
jgi:hypothetical protein